MDSKAQHSLLTPEKLTQIIRSVEKTDDVSITSHSVSAGSGKGDNFSGELVACDIAADVDGVKKDYHWMIKMESLVSGFVDGMHMEETEILFYHKFLPAWNAMAEERGADFRLNCLPSPYGEFHAEKDIRSILVMENLTKLGYADGYNKKKGLSLGHAKCVMDELAKYHALAYAYVKAYPGGEEAFLKENEVFVTDYLFAKQSLASKNMDVGFLKGVKEVAEIIQEPGQDFVGTLERFDREHGLVAARTKAFSKKEGGFNVVNHGDTWFNNMMFKHAEDGQTALACSLLDISICRYASPCCDIAYFLYSSTTPMLRETHLEEILGHYHDTFVRCLWQLNEDPSVYSYRQMLRDFNDVAYCGYAFAAFALPMLLLEKEDIMGQEALAGDMTDPEVTERIMENTFNKALEGMKKVPQIKVMVGGAILDMIKRGIFKHP